MIMGKEIVNLYGPGYITDNIGNVTYQISPLSFYQVNQYRRKSCMEQPWSMQDLPEVKQSGIRTAG